ncbi:hypothetical protein AALA24_05580 [Anaerovoracaceae bacterium 42-11]
MNGKDLLSGLSYLDEDIISEMTSGDFARDHGRKRWFGKALKGFGLAAACICIGMTGVFVHKQVTVVPQDEPVRVEISAIAVNEMDNVDGDRKVHLPDNCVEEVWSQEDLTAYFGRTLQPAYVPAGLKASPNNDKICVFTLDGVPYLDEVSLDFYHDFYEDGMPMMTKAIDAERGFTLTAWKKELMRDYMWISEEDQFEVSTIGNTEVTIGHRDMEYGPYDEKTHAPEGTYDLYVAAFVLDDVHYEFVSHQLPLSELVKVVTSFICETDQVVVE